MCARDFKPRVEDLADAEEKSLQSRLQAARAVMSDPGEKGRALEEAVSDFLRSFLPLEYGLTSGFVMYQGQSGPDLSSQLDIIIYDAMRHAPIAAMDSRDVLPLEAVYGYVEVKASLRLSGKTPPPSDSLEHCLAQSRELRGMRRCFYWLPIPGSATGAVRIPVVRIPIRSYVFAFECQRERIDPPEFAKRMANAVRRLGGPTHIHGLYVGGLGFFSTKAVESTADPELHSTRFASTNALLHMKWSILHGLARCWRPPLDWTTAVDAYGTEPILTETVRPSTDAG